MKQVIEEIERIEAEIARLEVAKEHLLKAIFHLEQLGKSKQPFENPNA